MEYVKIPCMLQNLIHHFHTFIEVKWGGGVTWLAQSVRRETLDLGVMSSRPTLGVRLLQKIKIKS